MKSKYIYEKKYIELQESKGHIPSSYIALKEFLS